MRGCWRRCTMLPRSTRAMVQLGLFTGMRRGEICGLRWSDIDFNAATISVNRTVEYIPHEGLIFTAPKTRASNRTFKVGSQTVWICCGNISFIRKSERLRVGSRGRVLCGWRTAKTVQNDLLFTAGMEHRLTWNRLTTWFPALPAGARSPGGARFHSLRHTYASLMIASHVPIVTVVRPSRSRSDLHHNGYLRRVHQNSRCSRLRCHGRSV